MHCCSAQPGITLCNSSTRRTEAVESWVEDQPGYILSSRPPWAVWKDLVLKQINKTVLICQVYLHLNCFLYFAMVEIIFKPRAVPITVSSSSVPALCFSHTHVEGPREAGDCPCGSKAQSLANKGGFQVPRLPQVSLQDVISKFTP